MNKLRVFAQVLAVRGDRRRCESNQNASGFCRNTSSWRSTTDRNVFNTL